ncbi:MAG: energy-coupling factor transporter ATPase, partial [Parolsenella sp.]|uniref:ABC transporter ATP-binding protein n=1 Tax=Parolsenella sp. TaxID=2083006 RepID=UPI002E776104
MTTGTSIIELKDVSFSYDGSGEPAGEKALDRVSLSISEGDFVGVIGPSGAGKSTLAAVMSGAIPHHFTGQLFGATFVDGRDTCDVTLTDISSVVGSVLQDIDAQMVASVVEDEMLFGLENFGVPHDQIEGRIATTLETVGISDLRDREIATLSGGQKQKVAIAAILALEPRVLVLDEPTAALDPASSRLVFETLREANERLGVTVVVIEQKVALLSEYCGRIVVMDRGHIAFAGTPHEVFCHSEELRALGVDSPRVARISNCLVRDGFITAGEPCLNVAEAEALVAGLVGVRGDVAAGSQAAADATAGTRPAASPHAPALRPHAEGAEPVVLLQGVSFSYPHGGASVRDLEMRVYPGELVGVVGQNGAGKTTLTKLLNGLLKPSSGSVRVAGLDTREVPTSAIAARCATLFQNPDRQLCKDTVLEEVAFGLELQGVEAQEAKRRAEQVALRFGLPLDEAPFSLSRGQRQMVALASVVVTDPDVVLLDEPTSGLD